MSEMAGFLAAILGCLIFIASVLHKIMQMLEESLKLQKERDR